jgi:hypothetical protein
LAADANEHPLPARDSKTHRHKVWRIIIWIGSLLVLALVAVLIVRHYTGEKEAAPAPAKITITTATAQKGIFGKLVFLTLALELFTIATAWMITGLRPDDGASVSRLR